MSAPVQASEGAELPPLTEAELAAIEAREKAATAGPWAFDNDKMRGDEIRHGDDVVLRSTMPWHDVTDIECAEADRAFIAAARTDVPRLLADLRAVKRERDVARATSARLNARAQAAEGVILRAGLGDDFENVDPARLLTAITERATSMATGTIRKLEAEIEAMKEAHREDQRRADELAGVPG